MSRPSLGVVLVVMGNPGVRGDVRMSGFSSTASLDEVCRTLAATGQYREQTLRINALRALSKYVEKKFTRADDVCRWLTTVNRRLAVWAACSCAREALEFVAEGEERPRAAIETAEAWVAGQATKAVVSKKVAAAEEAVESPSAAWSRGLEGAANAAGSAAEAAYVAVGNNYEAQRDAVASARSAASAFQWGRDSDDDDELQRLVRVITERLVLFPEWTGKPSYDRWPLPTKRKR